MGLIWTFCIEEATEWNEFVFMKERDREESKRDFFLNVMMCVVVVVVVGGMIFWSRGWHNLIVIQFLFLSHHFSCRSIHSIVTFRINVSSRKHRINGKLLMFLSSMTSSWSVLQFFMMITKLMIHLITKSFMFRKYRWFLCQLLTNFAQTFRISFFSDIWIKNQFDRNDFVKMISHWIKKFWSMIWLHEIRIDS